MSGGILIVWNGFWGVVFVLSGLRYVFPNLFAARNRSGRPSGRETATGISRLIGLGLIAVGLYLLAPVTRELAAHYLGFRVPW